MSTTSEERISGADVLFLGYSVLIFFVRGTRFFCTETRSFGFTLFRLSFLIIAFLVFRLLPMSHFLFCVFLMILTILTVR
jgi:hypothetical protein